MKISEYFICYILSIFLVSPLTAQTIENGSHASQDSKFVEAMAVCDNMGMYVQSAQRQAAMGMPLEAATQLVSSLMHKNLKVGADIKAGAIALSMTIYSYVYGAPERRTESVDTVLGKTCGTYRGYDLNQKQIDKHLATTAQSAWNPMVRVSLCTKLAQSAANIATARDKGIPREKISEIATSGLKGDNFTLARLQDMIRGAYDNPHYDVAFIYGESMGRCSAHENLQEYAPVAELWERYSQCKSISADIETIKQCQRHVLQSDLPNPS